MNIYHFSDERDHGTLRTLFLEHFKRKNLIPFFGSGFTRGYPASKGNVPSVAELKDELVDVISSIKSCSPKDRTELRRQELSRISDFFWAVLNQEDTPEKYRERFFQYIEDHFCGVHDLPMQYHKLLECRWRYLYTLNYDDAIEEIEKGNIYKVVPYDKQNRKWLNGKRCLYKLHGDASRFLNTGEQKFCILSTQQYLQAMNDDSNKDMQENLETDFGSNNLIFFGCSLVDELDMLFAAGTKLKHNKKYNSDTHSYYIRYVDSDNQPLTFVQEMEFENYAITDIIEVRAEDILTFYSFLVQISEEAERIQDADSLQKFIDTSFLSLQPTDRKNIDYLFYSSKIQPREDNTIVLPGFFIRRQRVDEIISDINQEQGHLHVLRGGRLCGKTYALIDLLKEFHSRNTYYFKSGVQISDECFERLFSIKNAILIFDEQSLSANQLAWITSKGREKIEEAGCHIVTAIDRSVGMFTSHYYETHPEMNEYVKIYRLTSEFNDCEIGKFNNLFGNLGLPDYEKGWSLLDFMLHIDEACVQSRASLLPDINVIQDIRTLKSLILFANQEAISIYESNAMNVTDALYDLSKVAGIAVQKDYFSEAEISSTIHSSFRFMTNSKYWVYKCLSAFAKDRAHYDIISDAFYDIVDGMQKRYRRKASKNYYQDVKPYYFFDAIQFMFFSGSLNKGGSLSLPKKIYQKLLPLFKDDFQFMHQKAKCMLWNSKHTTDEKERLEMLDHAYQQVNRGYLLAEHRKPINLEYTLYHMNVTKTLILANSWRYCCSLLSGPDKKKCLSELLQTFYKTEQQISLWGADSELDEGEMADIKWLVKQIGSNKLREYFGPAERKLAGEILTIAFQKNIG